MDDIIDTDKMTMAGVAEALSGNVRQHKDDPNYVIGVRSQLAEVNSFDPSDVECMFGIFIVRGEEAQDPIDDNFRVVTVESGSYVQLKGLHKALLGRLTALLQEFNAKPDHSVN